jgi:hypothetical protein
VTVYQADLDRYKDVFTGPYVALESEAAAIRIKAHLVGPRPTLQRFHL